MEIIFNKEKDYHEFVGSVDLWVDTSTYVDVDGKRYWNHSKDVQSFTSNDLIDKYGSFVYDLDFSIIGFKFKILLPNRNYEALMNSFSTHFGSTVPDVNFARTLFDKGFLPKEVIFVSSCKIDSTNWRWIYENYKEDINRVFYDREFRDFIKDTSSFDNILFGYGPYYSVYYHISSEAFLTTDYKNLPEYLLKILIKLKIFSKRQNIESNALNLLKIKTDRYEPKKW